eukprot:SAG11_NODE_10_length_27955_cov_15.365235_19_plen_92_part_00
MEQHAHNIEAVVETRDQLKQRAASKAQAEAEVGGSVSVKAQLAATVATKLKAEQRHNKQRLAAARRTLDAEKAAMFEAELLAQKRYNAQLQ